VRRNRLPKGWRKSPAAFVWVVSEAMCLQQGATPDTTLRLPSGERECYPTTAQILDAWVEYRKAKP
jgi:hypothetical protein